MTICGNSSAFHLFIELWTRDLLAWIIYGYKICDDATPPKWLSVAAWSPIFLEIPSFQIWNETVGGGAELSGEHLNIGCPKDTCE